MFEILGITMCLLACGLIAIWAWWDCQQSLAALDPEGGDVDVSLP